jgi:NADH-quinone oxidoreductase subunit L
MPTEYADLPPGLIFVVATFLPLASFTLLLVWGGLRWTLRPYARHGGLAADLFDGLGGDVGGRAPAIVATVAIGLACVLCVTGLVLFMQEHTAHESEVKKLRSEEKGLDAKVGQAKGGDQKRFEIELTATREAIEEAEEKFDARWGSKVPWAGVLPRVAADPGKGTADDPGSGTMLFVGYRIDMLSALMFAMVTFIATLIHLFSMGYMADELQPMVEDHEVHAPGGHLRRRGRFGRFFMFLSLFCFSMLNLILADNLFQIFVSWELVGICSFLLIGFYFERHSASSAANKAFITNRVGDAGFLIGLMILWTYVGTFNFEELVERLRAPKRDAHHDIEQHDQFITASRTAPIEGGYKMTVRQYVLSRQTNPFLADNPRNNRPPGSDVLIFPRNHEHIHFGKKQEPAGKLEGPPPIEVYAYDHPSATRYGYIPYWMLVLAGVGIFLGCVGKSAQFPLQVWLPDAMEGPTPVSALIHAATMVAAGVYLVARVYPLFLPEVRLVIAYTGGITLFVAATVAVVMTDIKKVLAYSTVSQLGYMMLALGVGGWVAGGFHLITHAFFKALLFLGSGAVIYGCHHQQDMLKMGGLYRKMRVTAITMLIGVLAICGVPLFAGWYSKDAILVSALSFVHDFPNHTLLFVLPLATAGLTTFYMFRMWFMTFTGPPRDPHVFEHAHESPWLMTVPLILLAAFSIFVAWGMPPWEAHASRLAHELEHSQPESVAADFGNIVNEAAVEAGGFHQTAGNLALLMVVIGAAFAWALYYKKLLDPAEAQEQFPGVHRFLRHKWYFDELYSAVIVRPGMVLALWARAFDTYVIDGLVNVTGRWVVRVSSFSGSVDRGIVDGLVNVLANVSYAVGAWFRTLQTGYLRSYVLFLALAAIGMGLVIIALGAQ